MAVKLENKSNVQAPAAPFTSFGNIKDESSPGANDGTPVNTAVYQDIHQFFAKMADAVSLAYNGLADNDVNDFQYFEALISNIRATAASATQKGTVERATQAEVNAGTDTTRHLTTALIAGATAIIKTAAIQNAAITDIKLAEARVKIPSGSPQTKMKTFDIGDWDMSNLTIVTVAHGVDGTKIRAVIASVRQDAGITSSNPAAVLDNETSDTRVNWNDTNILLVSFTSGKYDDPLYNATSFNRGWITIIYEE